MQNQRNHKGSANLNTAHIRGDRNKRTVFGSAYDGTLPTCVGIAIKLAEYGVAVSHTTHMRGDRKASSVVATCSKETLPTCVGIEILESKLSYANLEYSPHAWGSKGELSYAVAQ